MATVNYNKLAMGFYALLFLGVALWGITFFVQMQRDLKTSRVQESANQQRLDTALARLKEQEAYLERLQRDPVLVERIIRQKLGYARNQEFIFRFEEMK
ncbi:MAG: septum formation initiator family protein [Lacunisphaera sp.]|nr:septum formation initiator family protein [Lacunisphaera sp.]